MEMVKRLERGEAILTDRKIWETGLSCILLWSYGFQPEAHVENNHNLFRYVCPNGANLKKIGLQFYKRESLMGKSPIEVFNYFHDGSNLLEKLEIKEIDSESIDLTLNLIKK